VPDRLRTFLEHPLGPGAARAVVVLASAVFLGFAAVVVLAAGSGEESPGTVNDRAARIAASAEPATGGRGSSRSFTEPAPGQDPQDRPASPTGRRARHELQTHRALQHIPYRRGTVAIGLAGAEHGKAVVRVTAPTIAAARGAWAAFLQRYADPGTAYRVRLEARTSSDG
jgi:hypothetical protein